jgi:hypothetical protein
MAIMAKSNAANSKQPAKFAWIVAGIFAFAIGLVFPLQAALTQHFPLWLSANHYVPGELEVTQFHLPTRRSGPRIDGQIHPGGQHITTSGHHLNIERFVDPKDIPGRRVPLRGEIEGQRIAVLYLPKDADVLRWWDLPAVVLPETIQRASSSVFPTTALGLALVAFGAFCLRRGFPPSRG